jgi:hypothetical protein
VRGLRPVILVVSLAIVIAGAVLLLPTLLLQLTGPSSDKAERDARAEIDQQVHTYATRVVGDSTSPAGPSTVDLNEFAGRASLDYTADRSEGALVALWVDGRARASGAFGAHDVNECYTIRLHGLGTAGAGSQVTHLPDCRAVSDRIAAEKRTAHPTSSPSR